MKIAALAFGVLLGTLAACAEDPRAALQAPPPGPAIVLRPVVHTVPKASPKASTAASVLADYRLADRLALAYVLAPGATPDGILRVRVLSAEATRAVTLMRHRGRPEDISHAAAAVAELLQLVR